MSSTYIKPGKTVTYTNSSGSTITAGSVVVMKHTIGVALVDIENNSSGEVAIDGVHELPKVSSAVFVVGEKLIWDVSAGAFDDSAATTATGDITGAAVAMKAGANSETTCEVLLTPGNATLTP